MAEAIYKGQLFALIIFTILFIVGAFGFLIKWSKNDEKDAYFIGGILCSYGISPCLVQVLCLLF